MCASNEWSFVESLRMSQSPIVLSLDPVMRRLGEEGANATAFISAEWPSTCWLGFDEFSERVSQIISCLSSPTEANM